MSAGIDGAPRRRKGWRAFWLMLAGVLATLLVLANAHLVYVAIGSQPDCVPHAKVAGESGTLRAARSAC